MFSWFSFWIFLRRNNTLAYYLFYIFLRSMGKFPPSQKRIVFPAWALGRSRLEKRRKRGAEQIILGRVFAPPFENPAQRCRQVRLKRGTDIKTPPKRGLELHIFLNRRCRRNRSGLLPPSDVVINPVCFQGDFPLVQQGP